MGMQYGFRMKTGFQSPQNYPWLSSLRPIVLGYLLLCSHMDLSHLAKKFGFLQVLFCFVDARE